MVFINVVFENSNKFYFEGEIVRIKLEVRLEKASVLNNVIANFVGVSAYLGGVDKPEDELTTAPSTKIPGKDFKEIYFDDVLPIFMTENKEAAVWSEGTQVFMFAYQLPHNIPTSIESALGFVRYSVHVYVDVDGDPKRKTEHFTIVAKTDVNNDRAAHLPGIIWQPETQCILLTVVCLTNRVRAFVHLAKQGYIPGECLFINAEISNFHSSAIEWVKASLVQVLKFCHSKALKERRVVAEITRGCVLPFDTQTWRSESVLIPAIPPTTYRPKRLISVKYELLFQYKPSWKRKAVDLKQKITIGTVRLVTCKQGPERGEGEGVYNSELFNGSNLEPCIFGPHPVHNDGDNNAGGGGVDDATTDAMTGKSTFSPLYPINSQL